MKEAVMVKKLTKTAYLEEVFFNKYEVVHALIERILGVTARFHKSSPYSYMDTSFSDEITLIEMPRKFSPS